MKAGNCTPPRGGEGNSAQVWTYTRANRTITEGRRALLERLGAIESGAECERWLPLLSLLADGEASAGEVAELRPHLRSCPGCRATLRDAHAVPAHVAMLVPPAVVDAALHGPSGSLPGHLEVALHAVAERATLLAARVHGAFEALPGAKLAAVAASTAALAGGGVAIEQAATQAHPPSHLSAHAIGTSATTLAGSGSLTTIAFPLRRTAETAQEHRARRSTPPRSEFTPPPSAPSEFSASAPPRAAEFAAAPTASPAAAGSAPAAPPPESSPAPRSSPSEFGGP